jgi:hypothetical protein
VKRKAKRRRIRYRISISGPSYLALQRYAKERGVSIASIVEARIMDTDPTAPPWPAPVPPPFRGPT